LEVKQVRTFLLTLILASVAIAGCGHSDDTTAGTPAVVAHPSTAGQPDTGQIGGAAPAGAKVLHGPGTAEDAKDGYVIKPPDPDNPAYKPDPKMGGGG